MWKMLERSDRPLVAWLFNTEGLNSAAKRSVARLPLGRVDRFVVHSTAEIDGYADLLRLPVERFEFVPLQYGGDVEARVELPLGHLPPVVVAVSRGQRQRARRRAVGCERIAAAGLDEASGERRMTPLKSVEGSPQGLGVGSRLQADDDDHVEGRVFVGQDLGELEASQPAVHGLTLSVAVGAVSS